MAQMPLVEMHSQSSRGIFGRLRELKSVFCSNICYAQRHTQHDLPRTKLTSWRLNLFGPPWTSPLETIFVPSLSVPVNRPSAILPSLLPPIPNPRPSYTKPQTPPAPEIHSKPSSQTPHPLVPNTLCCFF